MKLELTNTPFPVVASALNEGHRALGERGASSGGGPGRTRKPAPSDEGSRLGATEHFAQYAEPPPHICQRETWAPVREEVMSLESPEVPTMRTDTQAAPPMDRHAAATENGVEPPVQTAGPRDTLVDGKKQMQE